MLNPAVLALAGTGSLVLLLFRSSHWWFLAVCLAAGLGAWRGHATLPQYSEIGQRLGQSVVMEGRVGDDPTRRDSDGRLQFTLTPRVIDGVPVHEPVRVVTNYQDLMRGYSVVVSGKIQPTRGAARFRFGFGQVTVVSKDVGWLERVRQYFFAAVRSSLAGEPAGFVIGLLVGARSLISKDLQDRLADIGLSHVVAVSGTNLTIIVQAVTRVLGGRSLFITTAGSLWLIAAFLVIAGMSASIVRAAIVSGISLVAAYYGLRLAPMTIISVTALATAAYRPDYLMSDLGWQLSFIAFWSVLQLAPLIEAAWVKRPNVIKSLLIESSAAHISTAPLVAAVFGKLSVIAPLANLVVVPAIPMAMLLGFLIGVSHIVSPALSAWIALPAAGLLSLTLGLVQLMSKLPLASTDMSLHPLVALAVYIGLGIVMAGLHRRLKSRGGQSVEALQQASRHAVSLDRLR